MPKVYVLVIDVLFEAPQVLGVSATLEGAHKMALEYFESYPEAAINQDNPYNVRAGEGFSEINIFERTLEVPENGFSD